jgi:hypothetical protein
MPDQDYRHGAIVLQIDDPGEDIQDTLVQDVGVTVVQPQRGDAFLTQPFASRV